MKKNNRFILLMLTLLCFALLSFSCSPKNHKSNPETFDSFMNSLFTNQVKQDTLTLNYSLAHPENYGITEPVISLGHYTLEEMKRTLVDAENNLALLNNYDYDSLSTEQQLTYDILKESLSLENTSGDMLLYHEILGPTTGLQAQLPVLLAEYNFYTKQDIDTYVKLLPIIYDYFEEICAFERLKSEAGLFMSDKVADNIIDQCSHFIAQTDDNYLIEIFNDKISDYEGLTEVEVKTYKVANENAVLNDVIPAYQLLINTLTDLKGTGKNDGGLSNFPKGKEYYEYLFRSNTGSSRPIKEIIEMLDSSLATNLVTLNSLMTKDTNVYEEAAALSYPLTDPVEILEYLKSAIKKDFPECPEVNYNVKYVHKSLQEHLSPAMYLVPAIDNYKNNIIYINKNPDYNLDQIFNTLAHEGYPGHLYQSVYFRNTNPSPIRSLLDFGGYAEGWATYVEFYSYSLAGFSNNLAAFMEANMAANMSLYCRLDIGINYEGWTISDTASYLKDFGLTKSATVELLYTTMLEEPALYPQYGIGYLEFMELKKTAKESLGDNFNLKNFHKFLLDIGPAQFDIIADRLEPWIKEQ
ncbi:MAG: hypothetical protein K0S61_1706 [Anaerocolumna sp.]|nr:hypothetical protein [Anaerocolumna sp.]